MDGQLHGGKNKKSKMDIGEEKIIAIKINSTEPNEKIKTHIVEWIRDNFQTAEFSGSITSTTQTTYFKNEEPKTKQETQKQVGELQSSIK